MGRVVKGGTTRLGSIARVPRPAVAENCYAHLQRGARGRETRRFVLTIREERPRSRAFPADR
jgi:hypothetical protein